VPEADGLLSALRHAFRLGSRPYRADLAHLDLTARQAALLLAVEGHPGHGVKFAAGQIGADVPTCSALVTRLEERSLIERRADPADRRRTMLFVTPDALPLVDAVLAARAAADERMTMAAGADLPLLRQLLTDLADRLSAPPSTESEKREPVEA